MSTIPNREQIIALQKKYAPNEELFTLIFDHCQIVAEIALWSADNSKQNVDKQLLEAACLLHDIGSYVFMGAATYDRKSYPQHAMFGAKILEEEGIDQRICDMVRTHVLLGLTAEEIKAQGWALPHKDFEPTTIEGRLLCYGDRFHSKDPVFSTYDFFISHLKKGLPKQAAKFEAWSKEFGVPDVPALAKKYGHPIR